MMHLRAQGNIGVDFIKPFPDRYTSGLISGYDYRYTAKHGYTTSQIETRNKNEQVIQDAQDKVFSTINSSATLSLETIQHSNSSGCL